MTRVFAVALAALALLACSSGPITWTRVAPDSSAVEFRVTSLVFPHSLASERWDDVVPVDQIKCRGVATSPQQVITAAHCLRHVQGSPFIVQWVDHGRDVAYLHSPEPLERWSPLSETIPDYAFTHRGRVELIASNAFNGPVQKGDSGGAIQTERGELVGIVRGCFAKNHGPCAPHLPGLWVRP